MSLIGDQVKQLREYSKELESSCSPSESYMVKQAADTIEELSAKLHASQMERSIQYYNCGWIPCEDRPPETNVNGHFSEDMLVAIKWYDGDITMDIGYYNSKSTSLFGSWSIDCDNFHVIAWRPLPEKYKEKERD